MTTINVAVSIFIVFFVSADAYDGAVAFHASSNSRLIQPKIGEVLPLADLLTNEGNGYDSKTCVFTAPTCGVYELSLQVIMKGFGSLMGAVIEVEGQKVSVLEAYNKHAYDQAYSRAVVYMRKGQKAKALCRTLRPNANVKVIGQQHTIFSGFLISK